MGLMNNAVYALILAFSLAGAPGISSGAALAADTGGKPPVAGDVGPGSGPGPSGWHGEWCKDHPDACKERRARHEKWCKDNPEKCAKFKERMEWCKKNPEQCKAERKKRHEEWCKNNPEKCAKMKELRETCKKDPQKCRAERRKMRQEWCKEHPDKCKRMHDGMRGGQPDKMQDKPDSGTSDE